MMLNMAKTTQIPQRLWTIGPSGVLGRAGPVDFYNCDVHSGARVGYNVRGNNNFGQATGLATPLAISTCHAGPGVSGPRAIRMLGYVYVETQILHAADFAIELAARDHVPGVSDPLSNRPQ